jgi:hypothetical protein
VKDAVRQSPIDKQANLRFDEFVQRGQKRALRAGCEQIA